MVAEEPDRYLAVLKASYDYTPQSDDEIAIKEDQLLLLVEKVDEDWWKVKIKATSQEADSPVGLVPAAYVEQAQHSSVVKVIYEYDAAAPGELSVNENDILLVFDTEDDWILVQNKEAGKAGYVPGNYVEVVDEEAPQAPPPTRIIVPDSPPRPTSTYVDPADRVASSKVTADDIQTWSVSEIDKKGKKKKGTLGVGNGAVFFASEADKTPVQKWQTKDVSSVSSEKSKHVRIDIGSSTPITLQFHAGSKENADAIISKLQTSKTLSSSSVEEGPARVVPPPPDATPREGKKASVHFSPASPVIIPPSHEVEDDDEQSDSADEPYAGSAALTGPIATALYDFTADGEDELSVTEGERLTVLEKDSDEWWKCRNSKGAEGVVPASYLEVTPTTKGAAARAEVVDYEAEARKARELERQHEAERLQKEHEEQERQEKEAAATRKSEAQRKAKEAALAAEAERQRRKEAAASRVSPPPAVRPPSRSEPTKSSPSGSSKASTELNRPPPDQTRIWHDRSGQFRVEAAFLGFNSGKLRLHKVNGVIVEVPSEKMSLDDMRYVEKLLDKQKRPSNAPRVSDDDIPLALAKPHTHKVPSPPKKASQIDWFDFFLSAGCDLDDCTRYAASFERDKIDEAILGDITEGTMRSLGLREGDIIRVKKAIEKRKPTDNLHKPSAHIQEQLRRDEELARQLQAQEQSGGSSRSPAPNLFAGPGGVLRPRRGRPQPSKSLPPPSNVDIKAISSVSGQMQRTGSPQIQSPATTLSPSVPVPPRPDSAPLANGFDDDAWTNRPSSTKPVKAASPAATPRAPSVPPAQPPAPAVPVPTPTVTAAAPQPTPPTAPVAQTPTAPNLAKTTEADIFEQLARLSELRKASTLSQPLNPLQTVNIPPIPAGYNVGMGVGSSPVPMGNFVAQTQLSPPPQPYSGPRGPFAPVPANQGLLQPLIPTQTGFSGFIPAKPATNPSPFQNNLTPPSLQSQPTGFNPQPLMSQPTGVFGNFSSVPSFQGANSAFGSIQSQPTGFNPPMNQSPFGNGHPVASPLPLPSNPISNTSPANVFAQMKSGTFAIEPQNPPLGSNGGINGQAPGWGQSYQGYTGY